MNEFKNVCVVGLGYIGLPTAATLASRGMNVVGYEISKPVVEKINQGETHIEEPDLDMLVKGAVNSGKLRASVEPEPADVFIIAVPTPFSEDKTPDISYIESAVDAISAVLAEGNLVILESTSPVGTMGKIVQHVARKRPDLVSLTDSSATNRVHFAFCPERVLPGKIISELVGNDRIIGGFTPQCAEMASMFYKTFVRGELFITNDKTAELAKLTENSYRDVNIAFANELSLICDELEINVWELIRLSNRHPRVDILQPGPGVGGHCIAVDPWFIVSAVPDKARLILTARQVNDSKPAFVVDKVIQSANKFKMPIIACLGLAFKANIDDLRESPAMDIVHQLACKEVGEILVIEPYIEKLPAKLEEMKNVGLVKQDEGIKRADIILLLVDHDHFSSIAPETLQQKVVIDTKGFWNR